MNKDFSIIFMGTPDFAVSSLKTIQESGITIRGVITAPDKPAGRGKKLQSSAVKQYALENNIENILQPTNLKDADFIAELQALNADLFVVVAFRMLPEVVWSMPRLGTINLHASILPNYRGAAPINWAIINGENKTGVTTFFIQQEIDTGKVIGKDEVQIGENDTAGILHDKLMLVGADLLCNTIYKIKENNYEAIEQGDIPVSDLKLAPKIFKEDCKIVWNKPTHEVYNHIRGLSPYPAAWTIISGKTAIPVNLKIFETSIEMATPKESPGTILFAEDKTMKISCKDGYINILNLQLAGKKRMDTNAFLRGFPNSDKYTQTL